MKSVAILQSNYIPWKGYFDLINMVDDFVVFDDVQYTKNDWRNRNKILTAQGPQWLTIPVRQNSLNQKINETEVADVGWSKKHWKTIKQNYSKAMYFKEYEQVFEQFYLNNSEINLSRINLLLIQEINKILEIDTRIISSADFDVVEGQTERLIGICKQLEADHYLSGPAAKSYFDEALASKNGIRVEWMDYSAYPEYKQLHAPFEHSVSILDLIFTQGPNAKKFMKSFR